MEDTRQPSDAEWSALFASFPPTPTERWVEQIREDLGGQSEEALIWHTPDGLVLRPFYRQEDLKLFSSFSNRNVGTSAQRTAWRIRQDFLAGDVRIANELARTALAHGADEIGFVLPPDSSAARPNEEAFRHLLDDIDLAETEIHFNTTVQGIAWLTMLLDEAARRGVDPARLNGSIEWDVLGHLLRSGRTTTDEALRELVHGMEAVEQVHAPIRLIAVDARPFHEGGAAAVREVAFALAALSEYLALLTDAGLTMDRIWPRIKLIVSVGSSFFVEVAKLRAMRRLAHNVATAYGGHPSVPIPATVETSYPDERSSDAHMNLLRGTTQAVTAILGGADTIHVWPFNDASQAPDAFGYRLARNTLLLLRHEAYLDRVVDPVDSSYYVEALTDALCRHAWQQFQEIEARGGLRASWSSGFISAQ